MERSCPSSNPQNTSEEDNLQFIQGIIHLKSTLKIGNALSRDEFSDIVFGFPSECREFLTSSSQLSESDSNRQNQGSSSQVFQDSGVGSSVSGDHSTDCISTTTISYLIRSSVIGEHLYSSVTSILNYLHSCFFNGSEDTLKRHIENWKGSLIEVAVDALTELVELVSTPHDSKCASACADFMMKAVDNIFQTECENKYLTLEYRCVLITELSKSHYLCEIAIHCIMKNIEEMCTKMKTSGMNVSSLRNIETSAIASSKYDTSFYLLNMLERLLKSWCANCARKQEEQSKSTSYENISELWKKFWGNTENSKSDNLKVNSLLEKWSLILQQAVHNTVDDFPNFSFLAWTCLQILENSTS